MRSSLGVLLGLFVVLVGFSIILDVVFHVHLPIVRSAFALLLIYAGVRILLGAWWPSAAAEARGAAFLSQRAFSPTEASSRMRYDVVFGESLVDLTSLPEQREPILVEVNAVFGAATVKIDPAQPIEIEASAAFAEARMPDQSLAAFGTVHYRPGGQERVPPRIHVRLRAVFGSVRVQEVGGVARAERPSPPVPAENAAH